MRSRGTVEPAARRIWSSRPYPARGPGILPGGTGRSGEHPSDPRKPHRARPTSPRPFGNRGTGERTRLTASRVGQGCGGRDRLPPALAEGCPPDRMRAMDPWRPPGQAMDPGPALAVGPRPAHQTVRQTGRAGSPRPNVFAAPPAVPASEPADCAGSGRRCVVRGAPLRGAAYPGTHCVGRVPDAFRRSPTHLS